MATRQVRLGMVTPKLLVAGVLGPLLGVIALVLLAGGVHPFVEIYRLLVTKAETLDFAIRTGDGPWYRYLLELLLLSPLVFVLAIGGLFTQVRQRPAYVYLVAFVVLGYAVMCNIRYGMNLRYTSIWDFSIRALAAAQVAALGAQCGRWRGLVTGLVIVALCAYDLRQYYVFFVHGAIYEPVTGALLQVVKILK
jgi:hypothetical protein